MGVANVEWVAKIWCGYHGFGYKFNVKIVVVVRVGYWVQIWCSYCCSVSCEIWCWLLGLSLDCSSLMIWAENIIVQVWWYEQRGLSLSLSFFFFFFFFINTTNIYIYIYIYIYGQSPKLEGFEPKNLFLEMHAYKCCNISDLFYTHIFICLFI